MRIVLAVVAAMGGIAFWRRKRIEEEAQRFGGAARQNYQKMRSGKKQLLVELGERVYAKSTGDEDATNEAEDRPIDRRADTD